MTPSFAPPWSGPFNVPMADVIAEYMSLSVEMVTRALKVDEDVTLLQSAATRFGERTGRLPSSVSELALAEGLQVIPVDPDGHPYKLTSEGRILVEHPDDFPFISKGVPPGYKPPPPKFHVQP